MILKDNKREILWAAKHSSFGRFPSVNQDLVFVYSGSSVILKDNKREILWAAKHSSFGRFPSVNQDLVIM